jgi:hypothetical protein
MYRLLDNTKTTYPRSTSHKSLYSPRPAPTSPGGNSDGISRRASTGNSHNGNNSRLGGSEGHSPPRLPYDEQEMDEREARLQMRKKLYSDYYPPEEQDKEPHQQQSTPRQHEPVDLDSSSDHSIVNRHTASAAAAMDENSETVTPRQHSMPPLHPPPLDRRRGSHKPWQTDVKLNRFSDGSGSTTSVISNGGGRPLTGSSSTQKSTLGWKQRMQERKAVFGNVAVPEQSFDEDDAHDDDEHDQQAIQEEAVQLLKDKGFTFQGILEHQYDDDLESVGGEGSVVSKVAMGSPNFLSPLASPTPVDSSGPKQQKLCLEDIQSLREKILRHQALDRRQDSSDTIPDLLKTTTADLDDEEPFDHKIWQKTSLQQNPISQLEITTSVAAGDENLDAVKAWNVMKQLRVRLLDVVTEDHYVIETMGRKGLDSPSQTKISFDEKAFDRYRLRDAVEKRVSLVFTGDHHIVVNGVVQPRDVDTDNQSTIEGSVSCSPTDKSHDPQDEEEEEESLTEIKSPVLRERLSDSFFVFESLLQARRQAALGDDEWTECSMSVVETPTARNAPGMIPAVLATSNFARGGDNDSSDDQSCWTECTIDTAQPEEDSRRQSEGSMLTNASANTEECDGFKQEEPTRTVKKSNKAWSTTQEEQSVLFDPFRQPGQAQLPVQMQRRDLDEQSYMEFTVRDDRTLPPPQFDTDDQSYTEMTVDDSSPTRQPSQLGNLSGDDDKSFMELTVHDGPGTFKDLVSPGMKSPHLTNMLSSRMFADMELPSDLRHPQTPQGRFEEENHDSYPTITFGHDDDDMTQITFDNTMLETGSDSQDHHHYAVQYLDNSSKTNGTYRGVTIDAPDLRSQHTEQTKDTTVSDDGSSHHDVASFKSCVSSESSQFVAELLRRDIWSPDAAVVISALGKLEQEALKGVQQRSNIVRYGGLLAILRSMDMKPDHGPIQRAACAALEKMAIDATTQVAIGEVGGIHAIAHAIEGHADDTILQQTACRALAILTRHRDDDGSPSSKDSFQAERVVDIVTKSMTKHPDDPEIQAHAFGALANLCLDSQKRLRELKQSGGLAAMTMALQVPWSNKTDQNEAISTLSILLRSLAHLDHAT